MKSNAARLILELNLGIQSLGEGLIKYCQENKFLWLNEIWIFNLFLLVEFAHYSKQNSVIFCPRVLHTISSLIPIVSLSSPYLFHLYADETNQKVQDQLIVGVEDKLQ